MDSRLSLSRKWLGPLDGMIISQLIAQNSCVTELDLSQNMLGQVGRGGPNLTTTVIDRPSQCATAHALTSSHTHSHHVASRYALVPSQRHDIAIVALGGALARNPPALRSVNLAKNYIAAEGAKALGSALPSNTTLKLLNLSQNEIDGASALALCEAMLTNQVAADVTAGRWSHNDHLVIL